MCFLFVSLIETNCFIKGNKLFLLEKHNKKTKNGEMGNLD